MGIPPLLPNVEGFFSLAENGYFFFLFFFPVSLANLSFFPVGMNLPYRACRRTVKCFTFFPSGQSGARSPLLDFFSFLCGSVEV